MPLSAVRLRAPAPQSVRLIAQEQLQRVLANAERLVSPVAPPAPAGGDPGEAIHELRVALRRLRIWLGAFRDCLPDAVQRDCEPRLSSLTDLTGTARDLEVQYLWLTGRGPAGPSQATASHLAEGIRSELAEAKATLTAELRNRLPEPAGMLAGLLDPPADGLVPASPEPMNAVMARALGRSLRALERTLRTIQRPGQARQAHRARIGVKRLRYLLEELGPTAPSAGPALDRLAGLQRLFGELHDAQVLARRIPRGFKALRAQLRQRIANAFRKVRHALRSQITQATFARIEGLIQQLEREGRPGRPRRTQASLRHCGSGLFSGRAGST